MAKLPANTVKRPLFDNPLRPTGSPPALELVEPESIPSAEPLAPAVAPVAEAVASSQPSADVEAPPMSKGDEQLAHRLSVRFTDSQWMSLQRSCRQHRVSSGENLTLAELVRTIVADWCGRNP
jgi:hypothetical protein